MANPIKYLAICSALVILGQVSGVAAQEGEFGFEYSYVEVQFLHTNFDTDEFSITSAGTTGTFTDATSNGFGLEAAFGGSLFSDDLKVYAIGDYMRFDTDLGVSLQGAISGNGFAPVEFTELRLGGGLAYEVDPRFALIAEAGYLKTTAAFSPISGITGGPIGLQGLDLDDGGIDLRLGFRAVPFERVELFGFIRRNPNGEFENTNSTSIAFNEELRYSLGGRFRFTEHVSTGAEYEFGEPGTVRLSLRYSF